MVRPAAAARAVTRARNSSAVTAWQRRATGVPETLRALQRQPALPLEYARLVRASRVEPATAAVLPHAISQEHGQRETVLESGAARPDVPALRAMLPGADSRRT